MASKPLRGAAAREWLAAHPKSWGRLERSGAGWHDPRTGHTFSARQVLRVTKGYTPEQLAVERRFQRSGAKDAGENLERLITSYRAAVSRGKRRGKGKAKGLLARKTAVAADSPFWQHLRDLRAPGDAWTGKKAKALVALGLRDPQSRVRVGSSPRGDEQRRKAGPNVKRR